MSGLAIDFDRAHGTELLRQVERQVFFIIGAARSGTSLLQAMIASHPSATLPNETGFFPVIWKPNPTLHHIETDAQFANVIDLVMEHPRIRAMEVDRSAVHDLAMQGERRWEAVLTALLAVYARERGAGRIGEKSPRHVAYLDHLSRVYPDARFIHVVRDPRAVVLSLSRVHFGGPFIWRNIRNYRIAYDAHRRHGASLGKRYLVVRYEDLVTDAEPQLRAVCEFLSLDFSPDMLEHHARQQKGFADWQQAHMANTLKPVFTSSIDKWKADLKPRWIALVEQTLGRALDDFGYERTGRTTFAPRLQIAASKAANIVTRVLRPPVDD